MTEALHPEPYTLDAFEQMTVDNFRGAEGAILDWNQFYIDRLRGEQQELFTQHGPGFTIILFPKTLIPEHALVDTTLHEGMNDELGDNLYFAAHLAKHIKKPLKTLCSDALNSHTGMSHSGLESFADLQAAVLTNADQISVPSTLGGQELTFDYPPREGFPVDGDSARITLKSNPGHVLIRFQHRLIRSLDPQLTRIMPNSITALEPLVDTALAVGDYVNALAYVTITRLGENIEDIALATKAKSEHRKKFGKK